MKRAKRMKLKPITILTSYKCFLEEQGEIPVTGALQHLRENTFYTKLKRRRPDGTKYLIFFIDAGYRKYMQRWTQRRMDDVLKAQAKEVA